MNILAFGTLASKLAVLQDTCPLREVANEAALHAHTRPRPVGNRKKLTRRDLLIGAASFAAAAAQPIGVEARSLLAIVPIREAEACLDPDELQVQAAKSDPLLAKLTREYLERRRATG